MTEEQALSPACQPLVGDMCRLLARLLQLSRLEAAPEVGGQGVWVLGRPRTWLAAVWL